MIETPGITRSDAVMMAMIRLTVPAREIRQAMGAGLTEVRAALKAQGIAPAGPWFTHHYRIPTDTFDYEICIPVTTPVVATGRVEEGLLGAARVARTVYHGGYEGLGAAWGEFQKWIEAQGLKTREDFWERYVVEPEAGGDSKNCVTELNRPLAE